VLRSRLWQISIAATALAWVVSFGVTAAGVAGGEQWGDAWVVLIVNAAGPATVVLAVWRRTQHPMDTYRLGVEEGRRLERESMDRHPRSGELRVCR